MRLLSANRGTLDALAEELQAQEVLERTSIERIVAAGMPERPRIAAASRGDGATG